MANSLFKGVQATKVAKTIPDLVAQGQQGGKIRNLYDKYVLTADLASGDSIDIGAPLPEGARLIDCIVSTGALGGSCTIDVGWRASVELEPSGSAQLELIDKTGFFSALPVSSATVAKAHGSAYEGDFYQKVLAADVQVAVWEHAVSSSATGLAIAVEVNYAVD